LKNSIPFYNLELNGLTENT